MDRTKDVPEVTQADREAAKECAPFWVKNLDHYGEKTEEESWNNYWSGKYDHLRHIPHFARHRTEATRPLTAEIADLRAQLDEAMEALDKCRCIIKFHVKNVGVCCTKGGEVFSALDAHNAAAEALAKRKQP